MDKKAEEQDGNWQATEVLHLFREKTATEGFSQHPAIQASGLCELFPYMCNLFPYLITLKTRIKK